MTDSAHNALAPEFPQTISRRAVLAGAACGLAAAVVAAAPDLDALAHEWIAMWRDAGNDVVLLPNGLFISGREWGLKCPESSEAKRFTDVDWDSIKWRVVAALRAEQVRAG